MTYSSIAFRQLPATSGAPGEKDLVAAVVPVDPSRFNAQALFGQCRSMLEANSVPSFLQVVAEIPKTASEKPQERFLLEQFDPAGADVYQDRSLAPQLGNRSS